MYQALYRKYRPMTFRDVVGQAHVTTTLKNEIKTKKIAHAYLFSGTRGTGKTTCARILAKGVNCQNPKEGDPCNECVFCRGVNEGTLLDVIEIDGASNTGVDNIRDLREEALYTPAMSRYKVYIIDEVHMLSTGAFNALLKILEDPPSHVIFVLATTEAQKIAPTILSRCQRFDFFRLTQKDIAERLAAIAKAEGFSCETEALRQIAALSDGAMRDAVSMLDQCAASGETITLSHVLSVLGLSTEPELLSLLSAVAESDPSSALTRLAALYGRGASLSNLCSSLLELFRKLMIVQTVEKPGELLQCDEGLIASLRAFCPKIPLSRTLFSLSRLEETLNALPRAFHPRAAVEMCLLSLCDPKLEGDISALSARVAALEGRALTASPSSPRPEEEKAPPAPPVTPPPPPREEKKQAPEKGPKKPSSALACWAEIKKDLSARLDQSFTSLLYNASAYAQGGVLTVVCDHPLAKHRFGAGEAKEALLECAARHMAEPVLKLHFATCAEFAQKQEGASQSSDGFDEFLAQNAGLISVTE